MNPLKSDVKEKGKGWRTIHGVDYRHRSKVLIIKIIKSIVANNNYTLV